jgi:hypothetical protein
LSAEKLRLRGSAEKISEKQKSAAEKEGTPL